MPEEDARRARGEGEGRERGLEVEARRAPALPVWATGVYLLLWSALMLQGWSDRLQADAPGWLQYPAWSAGRMTNRDLELAEAVTALPPRRRQLWEWLHGTRDEVVANAIAIDREVALSLEALAPESPEYRSSLELARVQLAVLLAESGERDEALETAEAVAWPPDFAAAMLHAYGGAPAPRDAPLEIFAAADLSEWSYDRVAAKLAERAGELERAEAIERGILERGRRWLRRVNGLFGANLAIGVFGVIAMALWVARTRPGRPAHWRSPPTPWSLADGLGVLVRGDFWNRLYYALLPLLDRLPPQLAESGVGELLTAWATLFASLPLVWLTYRHLLLPRRRRVKDPLGLRLRRSARAWGRLAAVGLVALGVDLAGSYALGWASWGLGAEGHWAEGFDENLVWGPWTTALLTALDYVAWAPMMEELAFRGVLFFSLRRRLGAVPAALLSATIFGLVHFYGLPGLLMTFWSGLVWALAFERTRSLLPGVAAHSVYNLLYVLGLVMVYR